ncbi:MAG TPA: hypothetical protein PLI95_24885, partial [Polyangiaceae bacterium]|nr:hypothetical protein [Polyangiaceae bacterium]
VTTDGKDVFVDLPALEQAQIPYTHKLQCYVRDNCLFTFTQGGVQQLPVTFIFDDADSKVEYIRTRPFVAKRVEAAPDAGNPPPPPPPEARLDIGSWVRAARSQSHSPVRWFLR